MNSASYHLCSPFSLNKMFDTGRHRRTKSSEYTQWCHQAEAELLIAGARPVSFEPPYHMCWLIGDRRENGKKVYASGDLSNTIKAYEDLLVRMGLIGDDNMAHITSFEVHLIPGKVGTDLTVTPGRSNGADHNPRKV